MIDSSAKPIRILHVDDGPDFAETAGYFLEEESDRFRVDPATSVAAGLDKYAAGEYDCIVSDYDMPGQNGIEFLNSVRSEDPEFPFILFTGKGSEEVASDAISAGVTDYLQKAVGTDQYTILANRVINAVERARAEQARQRHLEAIETAQEGMSILDENGEFIYVNEAYVDLYGYDRDELLGEHWGLLYPDEDVPTVHEEVLPQVETEGYWRGETTGVRADGSRFVEDHTLATTEHGELICTVQDLTDRNARKQSIEDLHSTARAFIRAETSDEVARITVDAVRDILDIPGTAVHLYDERADELVPVAWTERTEALVGEPPTFSPGDSLAWAAFESGAPTVHDDISNDDRRYDPETPIRSEVLVPLGDHGILLGGSPEPGHFTDTDVSLANTVSAHATTALDRVEREQTLAQQNDRLDAFTSVVSHDLQNPLNVATGRLDMAQSEYDSPHLDAVEQALDRTQTLLSDLHDFAQVGEASLDPEDVALAALCEACWQHVETGGATLVVETERTVTADRSRLQQLVENLVSNAVEHGGDDVTITVGDTDAGFYVADDGPGIPADERDHVFERGHTTSEANSGFGLTIVGEIADLHGWGLRATESDSGGARFELAGVQNGQA